jgi:hypothetical protein
LQIIHLTAALTLLAMTSTWRSAAIAADDAAALPPCPTVSATLNDGIDSATANVGDVIKFTTAASSDGAAGALPPGLTGFGIVSYARHARRGQGGELALEPRFVTDTDGTKVSVSGISANAVVKGSNRGAPPLFGAVGAFKGTTASIISGVLAFYGIIHYGGQAKVGPAAPIRLIVGDGIFEGTCSATMLLAHPNYRRR